MLGRVVHRSSLLPVPRISGGRGLPVAAHRAAPWAARDARRNLAIVSAAVALLLVDLSASLLPGGGAFLLLLIPVAVGSVLSGSRTGAAILLAGACGALLLVPLRGHPWLVEPIDAVRLVVYLAVGLVIVAVASPQPADPPRPPGTQPLPSTDERPIALVEPLTPRESEVLQLVAEGLTADEASRRLHVSRNTVKSHLLHAYGKLGAHNRAEAIGAGLQAGYLDREELGTRH
jgi:DNA-binding CsgD family transcriptional regulator